MGVTGFLMLWKVGQDDSQTYRSAKWRNIVGSKEHIMEISEDQKDALLTQELSHLAGSQALLIVSSMLKIAWETIAAVVTVTMFWNSWSAFWTSSSSDSTRKLETTRATSRISGVNRRTHTHIERSQWAGALAPLGLRIISPLTSYLSFLRAIWTFDKKLAPIFPSHLSTVTPQIFPDPRPYSQHKYICRYRFIYIYIYIYIYMYIHVYMYS